MDTGKSLQVLQARADELAAQIQELVQEQSEVTAAIKQMTLGEAIPVLLNGDYNLFIKNTTTNKIGKPHRRNPLLAHVAMDEMRTEAEILYDAGFTLAPIPNGWEAVSEARGDCITCWAVPVEGQ